MFATVLAEIASRHLSNQRTVTLIKSLEDTSQVGIAAAYKGLAFVQLYGTYEYSVCSAVQATLSALRAAGVEIRTLQRNVLALVLDACWQSAAEAGRGRVWERRLALIACVDSGELTSTLRNDLFPSDGSHYRVQQLRTIWEIFGVSAPVVPEARMIGVIEKLVENRNAVSHGRRTAEDVGREYSYADIAGLVEDTNAIAGHVVSSLEGHARSGGLVGAAGGLHRQGSVSPP